jgi:hypothetical protein
MWVTGFDLPPFATQPPLRSTEIRAMMAQAYPEASFRDWRTGATVLWADLLRVAEEREAAERRRLSTWL